MAVETYPVSRKDRERMSKEITSDEKDGTGYTTSRGRQRRSRDRVDMQSPFSERENDKREKKKVVVVVNWRTREGDIRIFSDRTSRVIKVILNSVVGLSEEHSWWVGGVEEFQTRRINVTGVVREEKSVVLEQKGISRRYTLALRTIQERNWV